MKSLFSVLLFVFSANAAAHGHWPQQLEPRYVLSEFYDIEFDLSNHFKTKTCFDIQVNGESRTSKFECLAPKKSKKYKIRVASGTNEKKTNVICSIAQNKNAMKTKMCTTATTMFPLSKLRGES